MTSSLRHALATLALLVPAASAAQSAVAERAAISDTRNSGRGVAARSDASAAANSGGGTAESDTCAD